MSARKFRKKPVIIEAVQWDGENENEIAQFMGVASFFGRRVEISTAEGTMTASIGDWIIRGVNGELYPCKPDIFDKTYEEVTP